LLFIVVITAIVVITTMNDVAMALSRRRTRGFFRHSLGGAPTAFLNARLNALPIRNPRHSRLRTTLAVLAAQLIRGKLHAPVS